MGIDLKNLPEKKMYSCFIIWGFTLIFFLIAKFKKIKINILSSLMILIFVTFFALLSPAGKVLIKLGFFKITQESLLLGLNRSGILIGMVIFSRTIVSLTKEKSNFLKNKLTEVFKYLDLLTSKKIKFKKGSFIKSIDEILCEAWEKR